MVIGLILLGIAAVLVVWFIATYNGLVKLRTMVEEGWSGIDVQLKRRADLIPNLIESVKGYMGHERGVLEQVTELRAKSLQAAGVGDKARAEGALGAALANLFAVAENYPDLKASQNFIELQKSLADIEDQIQLARRYYNGAARNFNILIQSFPSNLVANMFQFTPVEYFEIEEAAERAVPKVAFP
jgi:LemA protein